jgi:hypothetical protein
MIELRRFDLEAQLWLRDRSGESANLSGCSNDCQRTGYQQCSSNTLYRAGHNHLADTAIVRPTVDIDHQTPLTRHVDRQIVQPQSSGAWC